MEPLYAGLTAWAIELSVAGIGFYLLYREEQKVYKKRATKKADEKELEEFKEHLKKIDNKTKEIVRRYEKYWDYERNQWKNGFHP
jgi:hypothetical protein